MIFFVKVLKSTFYKRYCKYTDGKYNAATIYALFTILYRPGGCYDHTSGQTSTRTQSALIDQIYTS